MSNGFYGNWIAHISTCPNLLNNSPLNRDWNAIVDVMGIEPYLRLEFRPRVTEVTDVDFGFCNPEGGFTLRRRGLLKSKVSLTWLWDNSYCYNFRIISSNFYNAQLRVNNNLIYRLVNRIYYYKYNSRFDELQGCKKDTKVRAVFRKKKFARNGDTSPPFPAFTFVRLI